MWPVPLLVDSSELSQSVLGSTLFPLLDPHFAILFNVDMITRLKNINMVWGVLDTSDRQIRWLVMLWGSVMMDGCLT